MNFIYFFMNIIFSRYLRSARSTRLIFFPYMNEDRNFNACSDIKRYDVINGGYIPDRKVVENVSRIEIFERGMYYSSQDTDEIHIKFGEVVTKGSHR